MSLTSQDVQGGVEVGIIQEVLPIMYLTEVIGQRKVKTGLALRNEKQKGGRANKIGLCIHCMFVMVLAS